MGTEAPRPVVIPRHCAPMKAACPQCGKHGRRKRKLPPRRVRTVAYKAVVFLEITCGEYQARCDCCTTFRNTPEDVLPRSGRVQSRPCHRLRDLFGLFRAGTPLSPHSGKDLRLQVCLIHLRPDPAQLDHPQVHDPLASFPFPGHS